MKNERLDDKAIIERFNNTYLLIQWQLFTLHNNVVCISHK